MNVFTNYTEKVVPKADIDKNGLDLNTLGLFLGAHGCEVKVVHAENSTIQKFREDLSAIMNDPDTYVVVNVEREKLGENASAHFGPVSAYDPVSDLILVVDVARFKYPPLWFPVDTVYKAMNTTDGKTSRGYLIASYKTQDPPIGDDQGGISKWILVVGFMALLLPIIVPAVITGLCCRRYYRKRFPEYDMLGRN
jgi:hypothetical protein